MLTINANIIKNIVKVSIPTGPLLMLSVINYECNILHNCIIKHLCHVKLH